MVRHGQHQDGLPDSQVSQVIRRLDEGVPLRLARELIHAPTVPADGQEDGVRLFHPDWPMMSGLSSVR